MGGITRWIVGLILVILLLCICLPSREQLWRELELQHLPTPIHANWWDLWLILYRYGKCQ